MKADIGLLFACTFVICRYSVAVCPSGWIPWQHSCYYRGTTAVSFERAKEACQALGNVSRNSRLVTILSEDESNFLYSQMSTYDGGYWIGMQQHPVDKAFHWIDGSPVVFNDLHSATPQYSKHCVLINIFYRTLNGQWLERDCYGPNRYWCEGYQATPCGGNPCQNGGSCVIQRDSYRCVCPPSTSGSSCEVSPCSDGPCLNGGTCIVNRSAFTCNCLPYYSGDTCEQFLPTYGCPPGWSGWQDSCYFLFSGFRDFYASQTNCSTLGSSLLNVRLATIHSQAENDAIAKLANSQGSVWIGLKRLHQSRRMFGWVDGSTLDFTAWKKGQPIDLTGNEDCVEMQVPRKKDFGKWNVIPCEGLERRTICKEDKATPCGGNPCLNGGSCTVNGSSYFCVCPVNYTGVNCQDVHCGAKICLNGATCKLSGNHPSCVCKVGYRGLTCRDTAFIRCYQCSVCDDSQCKKDTCSRHSLLSPMTVHGCSHCIKYTLQLTDSNGRMTLLYRRVCESNRLTPFIGCQVHHVASQNYTRTTCVCDENLCNS